MPRKEFQSYCFVPGCHNTKVKTPNKLFFNVPAGPERIKWCKAVKREPVSLNSTHTCCEDHFLVEEDVEDWMRYKILKDAGLKTFKLKLKKGTLPHVFNCQTAQKLNYWSTLKSSVEKRKSAMLKEVEKNIYHSEANIEAYLNVILDEDSDQISGEEISCFQEESKEGYQKPRFKDFSCQVNLRPKFRSKSIQTDKMIVKSTSTSPVRDRKSK